MRCCVCGWADADAEHERNHLRSQYHYLKNESARICAPRGDNIVTDAILKLGRGLVRPTITAGFAGAFIAAVFLRLVPAEALVAATTLMLGWWFKERAERHEDAP